MKLAIVFLVLTVPLAAQNLPSRWDELTASDWPKAQEKAAYTCILPIGILEKHGPHVPMGSDLIQVREWSARATKKEYAVVFPDYFYGQIYEAQHQPGAFALPSRVVYFLDPSWLGAGFKAMPSDYSSPRLGERALNLLDDMNNWGLRKFLVGEVDVFKMDHTHELYGHMNINYLRLDRTPRFPDWSAVIEALKSGEYFVTTGEILIRDFKLNGVNSGGTAKLPAGDEVLVEAEVEWTFPLDFYELVWGDGTTTHRKIVHPIETNQFGRQRFQMKENLPAARWARFAVWDVAANGAFTQPVRLGW